MGTRNLTCVYLDGQYKVAQYGQWDGYPSGQGATALEFLTNITTNGDYPRFKDIVRNNVITLTPEEIHARWVECGADDSGWVTLDVSDKFKALYPTLSRDTAAEVLELIFKREGAEVSNSLNFAADSLFCEWCYVVDLDNNRLEVYKGFNTTPLDQNERFAHLTDASDSGYHPVKLLHSFDIYDLPSIDEFVEILEPKEEDEFEDEEVDDEEWNDHDDEVEEDDD